MGTWGLMDTLVVKSIQHFGESAEVTLDSGKGEIVAFSHPCDLSVGQVVPNLLHGMTEHVAAAYLSDWPESLKSERSIERLERIEGFAYRGCGQVADQAAGLVEVLGFLLELGDLPCTGFVEFECVRVDVPDA